ncbi:MAG TPA: phosphoheptose isomerase, partial [Acidimicrobiia bacterium]|nr:phosphoheptose isomerase [Acidimicrobiia bacterium]
MSVRLDIEAGECRAAIDARLKRWNESNFGTRLWDRDPTLWFDPPRDEITDRLGWLPPGSETGRATIVDFADEVRSDGIAHVVLLGMGGSSLAPEVFASVFANSSGPKLTVLDSTHPGAVQR